MWFMYYIWLHGVFFSLHIFDSLETFLSPIWAYQTAISAHVLLSVHMLYITVCIECTVCLTLAISSSHRVLKASSFCCISSSRTPPSISVWASSRIWFLLSSGCRKRTSRLCGHAHNIINHTLTDLTFELHSNFLSWNFQLDGRSDIVILSLCIQDDIVLFEGDSRWGRKSILKIMQDKEC